MNRKRSGCGRMRKNFRNQVKRRGKVVSKPPAFSADAMRAAARSADLYLGPKAPAGLESNWLDTSASKGWWVWFRFYGPEEPFFDQSWQLPDFEEVK